MPVCTECATEGKVGEVRDAWKIYLAHTGKNAEDPTWGPERIRLLVDLLLVMSKVLGYRIDRVEIENGIYFPRAHGQALDDQEVIRQRVAKILRGEAELPMAVKSMPVDAEIAALWREFLAGAAAWLKAQRRDGEGQ